MKGGQALDVDHATTDSGRPPPRVALLSWNMPPVPSGLGRAAHEIARSLIEAGAHVTVFDASRKAGTREQHEGVPIIGADLPVGGQGRIARSVRERMALGHLAAPWAFRHALMPEHAREPFDLIEATNWYAPAALLTGLGPAHVVRNSTPAIDAHSETASLRDRIDFQAAHRLEARTARRADALISNTKAHGVMIADLYELPEKPPRAVHHAIIPLSLSPAFLTAGAASALPDPQSTPRIVFVGRAERRKGFEEAVGGVARLAARWRREGKGRIGLDLVGVEPAALDAIAGSDEAVAAMREQVSVHPRAGDALLRELYAKASAVLAPSRYESFGLVYREAAAFGRPLVACAEDPAAREFANIAHCTVLADSCAPQPIAEALHTVLTDRDAMERMHHAGKTHASGLSRTALGAATLRVYEHALSNRRGLSR